MSGQEQRDDYLASQIARHDDELEALRQMMRAHVAEAVAEGIRSAVGDPRLWDAAGRAMREQAQSAAGGWLLGGIGGLAKRLAWIVAIGAGVYALGGWSALAALVKAQGFGGHP